MNIVILGAANSTHIVKIANSLANRGHYITVISLPNHRDENGLIKSKVIYLKFGGTKGYYLNAFIVKRILKSLRADILNTHYASGYGTLARLTGFMPYVLSVWGSDVYSFPYESKAKRIIVERNVNAASLIMSTSCCMANETRKLLKKNTEIVITPFGVDLKKFYPLSKRKKTEDDSVTIGFLKGSSAIYGIDLFLDVIDMVLDILQKKNILFKIKICGTGNRQEEIIQRIKRMKSKCIINYFGYIVPDKMPDFIRSCDIICVPSQEESFGVVAVESMACAVPVLVSDAPGLKEVVKDGVSGFVVPKFDKNAYVNRIIELSLNKQQRENMGLQGRSIVEEKYNWDNNIDIFINAFKQICMKPE